MVEKRSRCVGRRWDVPGGTWWVRLWAPRFRWYWPLSSFPFFISFMSPSTYNLKNTIDQERVLLYLFFSFKEAQRRFSFLLFRAAEQNGPG